MNAIILNFKYIKIYAYNIFLSILSLTALAALISNLLTHTAHPVMGETNRPKSIYIIDAGHGGFDGGAISYNGTVESHLNLEISKKLNIFMRYIGQTTKMIRIDDNALNDTGSTIREKKLSDLKNRVKIVNSIEDAILISIHQNMFADSRYSGAQVFFGREEGSLELAEGIQANLKKYLNPSNNRQIKPASDSIYLVKSANCPTILVECGFLSNFNEEQTLKEPEYQKKLAMIIGISMLNK